MRLSERNIKTGNWLFARRGWLPLFLYVVAFIAIAVTPPGELIRDSCAVKSACLCVSLLGIAIRMLAIGYAPKNTSGRNTSEGQVADTLNTEGIYSVLRHPLYTGNFFMWLGLIVYVGVDWFIVGAILLFCIYYEKIMLAEEDFLERKFGQPYLDWCNRTPVLLPRFRNWKKPGVPFSMKNAVKREYHGLFYLALSFVVVDIMRNALILEKFRIDPFWIWTGGAAAVIAIVVRILAKKTGILNVEGR